MDATAAVSQVREKFADFTGQELACIAWALRRFGYSAEHNAVFYMLQRQVRVLGGCMRYCCARCGRVLNAWRPQRCVGTETRRC